jgi:hypothetical protein
MVNRRVTSDAFVTSRPQAPRHLDLVEHVGRRFEPSFGGTGEQRSEDIGDAAHPGVPPLEGERIAPEKPATLT